MPPARAVSEVVGAEVFELEPRAGNEIGHRTRYDHCPRPGVLDDGSSERHGEPRDLRRPPPYFPDVHRHAGGGGPRANGSGEAQRATGCVEGGNLFGSDRPQVAASPVSKVTLHSIEARDFRLDEPPEVLAVA